MPTAFGPAVVNGVTYNEAAHINALRNAVNTAETDIDTLQADVAGLGTGGSTLPWINVRDYNVVGDGVANDTAAIQAIFNSIRAKTLAGYVVFFPEGQYKLAGTLEVDVNRIRIMGANKDRTRFMQTSANSPILRWDVPWDGNGMFQHTNEAVTRGIEVLDMGFDYSSAPTAANTQAYAIQFRASTDGSLSTGSYSWITVDRCYFHHCYVGIGNFVSGTGECPIWNSVFRDLTFVATKHTALKIASSGAGGSTSNLFQNIHIINWTGEGVTSNGPAIDMDTINGCHFDTINIEGWVGFGFGIVGGQANTITALRFEWHVMNTAYNRIVYLNGVGFVIDGMRCDYYGNHSNGWLHIIETDGGATTLTIAGVFVSRYSGSTGSGNTAVLGGATGDKITASGLAWTGTNVGEYLGSGNGTMLYARTSVNGLPPLVDALPTASVTYRGRQFRTEGATGVADAVYHGEKTATDTYIWRAL